MGTYEASFNRARKLGGDKSLYEDTNSTHKGVFAQHPASMPKYSTNNDLSATDTSVRLYFPNAKDLLNSNVFDKDILTALVGNGYIDFLPLQIQENFTERVQVRKLVNGAYASYFFGQEPPTLSITGSLLNDFQNDWKINFLRLYERYLRGTKLARQRKLLYISYDSILAGVIPIAFNTQLSGTDETSVTFSLNMLISTMQIKRNPIATSTSPGTGFPFDKIDTPVAAQPKKTSGGIRFSDDYFSKKQLTDVQKKDKLDKLVKSIKIYEEEIALWEADLVAVKKDIVDNGPTPANSRQLQAINTGLATLRRELKQKYIEKKAIIEGTAVKSDSVKDRSVNRIDIRKSSPAARSTR